MAENKAKILEFKGKSEKTQASSVKIKTLMINKPPVCFPLIFLKGKNCKNNNQTIKLKAGNNNSGDQFKKAAKPNKAPLMA